MKSRGSGVRWHQGSRSLPMPKEMLYFSCAQVLEVNGDGKMQEALSVIREEGGEDPVLILKAIGALTLRPPTFHPL
jgi:hypothetical protein